MESVTDGSGTLLLRESFGSFGARRGSAWTGAPTSGDYAAIANATRRGYTDHTELDNIALVHMNGRVYDPLIGRFLSADPNVDGEDNTQGWNRFSYVQNRPLSQWDPSGFEELSEVIVTARRTYSALPATAFSSTGTLCSACDQSKVGPVRVDDFEGKPAAAEVNGSPCKTFAEDRAARESIADARKATDAAAIASDLARLGKL